MVGKANEGAYPLGKTSPEEMEWNGLYIQAKYTHKSFLEQL